MDPFDRVTMPVSRDQNFTDLLEDLRKLNNDTANQDSEQNCNPPIPKKS
jgi:hypothetical protein